MAYNDKHIQIIETAEVLFAKKGYEASTVRDIAEEAGVNNWLYVKSSRIAGIFCLQD